METLDFYRGLSIIMFIVIVFCVMYVAKYKETSRAYKTNSAVLEDLLKYHKNVGEDWRILYEQEKQNREILETQVKVLNNEVARMHGRKDPQSYYAHKVKNGKDEQR